MRATVKNQVAGEEQGCQEPQELSLASEELKVENPRGLEVLRRQSSNLSWCVRQDAFSSPSLREIPGWRLFSSIQLGCAWEGAVLGRDQTALLVRIRS